MGAVSSALSESTLSRVTGQKILASNFRNITPNLPQYIAVLGEANTANQATIDINPFEFTNHAEVGNRYGWGSPLHQQARILRPVNADLVSGVKTVIYPQLEETATATVIKKSLTVATTILKNARHTLVINGRRSLEGVSYSYDLVKGQSAADVRATIVATVSAALSAPCSAAEADNVIDFTTKWAGATSSELNIEFDTNGTTEIGIVYAEVSKVDGTGAVDITATLALFQDLWITMVTNPYGPSYFDELEAFNGVPDEDTPTGRYLPTVFKPFCSYFGTVASTKTAVLAITDVTARKSQVTNVHCPAPNSAGFPWEAAANMIATTALISNDKPHQGNGGLQYFDMPVPTNLNIGDFAEYSSRDLMAKAGSSTVTLKAGKYQVEDFETTYHPDGEFPAKYRKVRDLMVNWNIAFGWLIIMAANIQDKTITLDGQPVRVANTISPSGAKQLMFNYFSDLQLRALINNKGFSENSALAAINDVNAARLDLQFKTKITSTADQVSTDNYWDFTFSS